MHDTELTLPYFLNNLILIQEFVPNVFIHLNLFVHVTIGKRVRCLYYFVKLLVLTCLHHRV